MNTVSRIVKNTIYLSLIRILNPAVSFLLIIFIARYKGISFLGNYSLILAFCGIFSMVSSLGLETLIVRDVSKEKSEAGKYMINGSILLLLSSLCFALVMCFVANIFQYEKEVKIALYVASLMLIPGSLFAVCRGLFKAFERNFYIVHANGVQNIVRVVFSLAILYLGFGLLGLMTVSFASSLLGLFIACYFTKNRIMNKIKLEVDFEFCKKILKSTLTFMIISLVVSMNWRVGIIILSKIEGPTAAGVFSAAFRLFFLIVGFVIAFGTSVFPLISQKYEMFGSEFENISVNSAKYIVIVIIFLAIIITFLSKDIIKLFYGIKFIDAASVLRVLVWAAVPFSMVTVFAYSLFSSYNQKIDLAINSIGLLINVILNLLLVPRFGYIGTAFSILISTCILLVCQYFFINRRLFRMRLTRILAAPTLSAALMASFVIILRSKVNLYILLLGSTFLYVVGLYLFNAFDETEKAYLRQVAFRLIQSWRFSLLRWSK